MHRWSANRPRSTGRFAEPADRYPPMADESDRNVEQHILCDNVHRMRNVLHAVGDPCRSRFVVSDTALLHWGPAQSTANGPVITVDTSDKVMVWALGAPDASFHISSAEQEMDAMYPSLCALIAHEHSAVVGNGYRGSAHPVAIDCVLSQVDEWLRHGSNFEDTNRRRTSNGVGSSHGLVRKLSPRLTATAKSGRDEDTCK
jgi:hypothetical protein